MEVHGITECCFFRYHSTWHRTQHSEARCVCKDASICKGKKVVVVGGGKSAIDNAVSAAKHGEASTLVWLSH